MGITILRVATATNPNNMLAAKVGKNCGCKSMNNRDVKITALPSFPFLVNAFNINPRKKSSSEMAAANPTIAIFITHSEKVLAWRSVCIVWIYSLGIGTNCWERLPSWSPITTNERDRGSAITKSIWEGKRNSSVCLISTLKIMMPANVTVSTNTGVKKSTRFAERFAVAKRQPSKTENASNPATGVGVLGMLEFMAATKAKRSIYIWKWLIMALLSSRSSGKSVTMAFRTLYLDGTIY